MMATHGSAKSYAARRSRVRVYVVVVGHGLAVELLGGGDACLLSWPDVQGGALVRVLAVAEHVGAPPQGPRHLQGQPPSRATSPGAYAGREPGRDRDVVGGGVHDERLGGARWRRWSSVKPPSASAASTSAYLEGSMTTATEPWFLAAAWTIEGSADVDLLHALLRRGAGRHRGLERVQVRDQQLERLDAEPDQLSHVLAVAHVGEQACVHPGVQRLDPAVEALGEAGQLHPGRDRHPSGRDPGRRVAGGDDPRQPSRVQPGRQVLQPGLVVDADQRPPRSGSWSTADPHLPATDGPAFADHPAHRADEQRARSATLISLVQRRLVVIVRYLDAGLRHDRSRVHPVIDDEDSAAGDLHAVGQCIPARRASRGNDGSSAGCVFRQRPPKQSRNDGPTSFMNPARWMIRSGRW